MPILLFITAVISAWRGADDSDGAPYYTNSYGGRATRLILLIYSSITVWNIAVIKPSRYKKGKVTRETPAT
jgi:hypothetical protein